MNVERVRETLTGIPAADYFISKAGQGWRPVAIEWERDLDTESSGQGRTKIQPPYGLQVASDCASLEENPTEQEALALMLELIVKDRSLSEVADALNERGYLTRNGRSWSQVSVFHMLPRLIETAPAINATPSWEARRIQLRDP